MGNRESKDDKQESQKEIFIHSFSDDLLSTRVDGLVCFTNRKWSFDDSKAFHLLEGHGRNQFTSELKAIKRDNADCEPGDVFVGESGMLPCKKVFFSVVPENELSEGSDRFDQKEVTMVTNILDKASKEEFFSLAIIFGGNDDGPNPTCLIPLIYCKFLMLSSSLQEIHLVSLDPSLIDLMQKVLRESHQLSVNQELMLSDKGPRNVSFPEGNKHSAAETTPKYSTGENIPASGEKDTAQQQSAESEDDDDAEKTYMNDILGMKNMKIKPGNDGTSGQVDEAELGAVGGSHQPSVFRQTYDTSDYGDDRLTKEMFTSSTASQDSNLDFVNILESPSQSSKMTNKVDPVVDPVSPASPAKGFVCTICMQEKGPLLLKKLDKCGHNFCKDCIMRHLNVHGTCPVCKYRYSPPQGNQPDGVMSYFETREIQLAGYESVGTIVVEYDIPDGIQSECHPNPGVAYKGLHRSAYLPDNSDGRRILALLRKAFDKKLIFTVGTSITTGRENVTTWNDIHHKTNQRGGPQRFGYPDPTYLRRVYDELISKGIIEDD